MTLKSSLAIAAGKSSYWFLHNFMHGGTSLPGKITLSIDPDVLQDLAKNYEIVIITGTNGKTLTTALTVKVLEAKYGAVLTNPSGSNMKQGIVTAFLTNKKGKNNKKIAVLETDEANVPIISEYIEPVAFVLTNLFRDQMDRYGEIYTTYDKILKGIKMHPNATVIANGDAPIFNSKKLPNTTIYYGFNQQADEEQMAPANTDGLLCPKCQQILHFKNRIYSNLGKYYCPNCGFQRPELQYQVDQLLEQTPQSSIFKIDGHQITIHIGGTYNIYNALAAYTIGSFLNVEPETAVNALSDPDSKVFGRQEVINVDGKEVTLILVKNPVGLDQVLQMIKSDQEPFSLAILLNANYADGIDTSWIWDGRFEDLPFDKIPAILTGGERYRDITFRLRVAGVPEENFEQKKDLEKVLEKIKGMPTKHVYVLATYTAVLQLRKMLAQQGYIEGGMD
ncbi:Mur ligase family protein [Ligilactobacillus pobuzihii]|uniref:Lipid II isoglutaminyl synthase (glutamine-hydrolyzing) subunit MurT n=1 Tax=Ligilactobacillus pobuzihii TaxID=449659 RepID=A0A0R2LGT7_9LACO|nr:Mur ligase family protein [Ligilactobacillus pobuzihii]KRK10791.1 UDP-N-acetylmuramoylalanyl-D-glutamate--2,6-diaminopimelate ligase [Ligilactobacillus pobuzihii E100301 = KCTC 13174]KRO01007.1 UDP-N-acetylmuramoylalanyl-D-glutamate--2,6-diaminopimelate ligase [Ligilactobacillus pobuzihii]GEN47918.1 UDP-N-acetylmuramyl peptide synthase [Ligilactobacillus pobuzihii]